MVALNEEQRAAVEHMLDYPAVVMAGAGSGKTTVLTQRIMWLMGQGVSPRKILAITFTNKAAGEMASRLSNVDDGDRPRISTIHSLALSAIRKNPTGFGLGEKITPIADYDQKQMVKKIIDHLNPIEEVNDWGLLEKIGFHRARGIGFRVDYTDEVHNQALITYGGVRSLSETELEIWEEFEKEKTKSNTVDFDDMLHLVVRRGERDERWRASVQKMYHHVLMDESQDTSIVQWKFVNLLLSPENKNIYIVGDLSQSIFSFSGASPDLMYGFTKDWRGMTPSLYKLEQNHRSVPEVTQLANKTQSLMSEVVPIQMKSFRGGLGERGRVLLRQGENPYEISQSIAEDILEVVEESFSDFAILVRSASQVRDIESALVKRRIPYIVRGAMGLMQTEEVKDLMSYMKILTNPNDYFAMLRSIGVPRRGIGDATLEKIKKVADQTNGNLLEAAKAVSPMKFGFYLSLIDKLKGISNPIDVLNGLLSSIQYTSYIQEKYKMDKEKVDIKLANIERLKEIISNMSATSMTTEDIVFQLTMQEQKDEGEGKVVISTIHAAKGLEWEHVYVTNLYEGSIPHKFCTSQENIQEERRVFYVACTRAKDKLYLCLPSAIEYYNKGAQFVAPSRFLIEIGVVN